MRILEAMEAQLQTPFMLGDRPTALDRPCSAVCWPNNNDPDPKRVTANYLGWSTVRVGVRLGRRRELAALPELTLLASFVLMEMRTTYQPYVLANRAAQEAGAKAFQAPIYGEESVTCRGCIRTVAPDDQARIEHVLNDEEHETVRAWLEDVGLTVLLTEEQT